MFICTFAGHREIYHSCVATKARRVIDMILEQHDEVLFYNGGMGAFDELCASLVNEAKGNWPEKSIDNTLVVPYLTRAINKRKAYYEALYDHIIVAKMPEGIHYKRAIQERNRWMADQCDCIIAYLHRDFGGAYDTALYAKKQGKVVINVAGVAGTGNICRHLDNPIRQGYNSIRISIE